MSLKGGPASRVEDFLLLCHPSQYSSNNAMANIDYIKLDQFLKQMQVVGTGGQAKLMIQDGEVNVNGEVETRRGRKLVTGDRVEVDGQTWVVDLSQLG